MKMFIRVAFAFYLIVLVKMVIFKGSLFFRVVPASTEYIQDTKSKDIDAYNFVPFRSIFNYMTGDVTQKEFFFNIFGNIFLFVPLGLLLPLLWRSANKRHTIAFISVGLSLFFELYQLLTHTGKFDVDDIILNTIGGVTGYLFLALFQQRLFRSSYQPEIKKQSSETHV